MSTKRVALLAKDRLLKNSQQSFYGNDQIKSINLNQKSKCENFNVIETKSNRSSNYFTGFADYNDSSVKSCQTWKQNDLLLSTSYKNLYGIDKEENGSKLQNQDDKEYNKSTLSLHIAEYENALEAQNVDGICMDKQLKQETFGLPRQQQQTAVLMNPEMMQFKASQKLMNPISRDQTNMKKKAKSIGLVVTSLRFRSTIFALSSGSLPSGVATIRISGDESFKALEELTRRKKKKDDSSNSSFIPKQLFYTKIYKISDGKEEDEILDHGMAVWLPGPNTFTGENTVELYLHGSKAVVNAVAASLLKIKNIEAAKAGEFTKRAFLNGKYNISQVESLNDLISAETESQRKLAIKQNKAGKYLEPIREKIINLIAQVQAAIDFGEDIENQKIDDYSNIAQDILAPLRKYERGAKRGSLIRDGIKVAIVGKTNVGKSSLMNRLAEKDVAIVSDICGTTRDFLETRLHLNACPITVVDTAGIRETFDQLEKEGIRRSFEKAEEANIIVYVCDAQKLCDKTFEIEMEEVLKFLNARNGDGRTMIVCFNKADLLDQRKKDKLNQKMLQYFQDKSTSFIWSSCFEECGLSTLLSCLQDSINDFCDVENDECMLSRQRHVLLLQESIFEMNEFLKNLSFDQALAAEHLQNAANCIGEISGTIVNEQILDKIFSQFCIGK